ncbi:MAG: winged helix-turn-helix transcriptional regulator, partial [Promethearchaeota archaeon]
PYYEAERIKPYFMNMENHDYIIYTSKNYIDFDERNVYYEARKRLKELEEVGIVDRTVYDDTTPIKVTYSLTDKGRDLYNVLDALRVWGERWGEGMNPCTHLNCPNCVYPIKKPSLDTKAKGTTT